MGWHRDLRQPDDDGLPLRFRVRDSSRIPSIKLLTMYGTCGILLVRIATQMRRSLIMVGLRHSERSWRECFTGVSKSVSFSVSNAVEKRALETPNLISVAIADLSSLDGVFHLAFQLVFHLARQMKRNTCGIMPHKRSCRVRKRNCLNTSIQFGGKIREHLRAL